MVILSSLKTRKANYEREAKDLERRAKVARLKMDDKIEAARLEKLAQEAREMAEGIDRQIDEIASNQI